MFAYIRGKLVHSLPQAAIVETASGIGYKIFIPANVFAGLPQLGTEIILYTSFVVRELSQALYGFLNEQERDLFEALLGVTGIGPKLALNLIGHLPLIDLHQALQQEDMVAFTRVPGIGKKMAERLIIEMRGKISSLLPFPHLSAKAVSDPTTMKINDAMNALINLGYNQSTAQKAIKKSLTDLPEGINLADLITHALKNI